MRCAYKCSINPIANPNPVCSHSAMWQYSLAIRTLTLYSLNADIVVKWGKEEKIKEKKKKERTGLFKTTAVRTSNPRSCNCSHVPLHVVRSSPVHFKLVTQPQYTLACLHVSMESVGLEHHSIVRFITEERNGPKTCWICMVMLHLLNTNWNIGLSSFSGVENPPPARRSVEMRRKLKTLPCLHCFYRMPTPEVVQVSVFGGEHWKLIQKRFSQESSGWCSVIPLVIKGKGKSIRVTGRGGP
jgi:hypothetical protein